MWLVTYYSYYYLLIWCCDLVRYYVIGICMDLSQRVRRCLRTSPKGTKAPLRSLCGGHVICPAQKIPRFRLLQCDIAHIRTAHVCYCFTLDSSALQKLWFGGSCETFRYNGPLQGRGEILDCSPMTPAAAAEDNDENTLEEYGMQVGGTQIGRHSHQLEAVGCWNGTTWARHGNTSATMNSINPTHFFAGVGDFVFFF